MSKTKLFLLGYFLPSWVAALMMWGDDRTSALFASAPPWFPYFKFAVQIASIMFLFVPFRLRSRPAYPGLILAVALLLSLPFAHPVLDAEVILLNSSAQIAILVIFLSLVRPTATLKDADLAFFFKMFLFGFILQFGLFFGFGRVPSHSIEGLLIRFNGITNDSLSVGLILPLFIPWAASGRLRELKLLAIMVETGASGSLFGIVFTALATFGYLLHRRMYRSVMVIVAAMTLVGVYFFDALSNFVEIKLYSILTHLRLVLDVSGIQLDQPDTDCSEEFCESFIEVGGKLNPVYLALFLALLIYVIVGLYRSRGPKRERSVVRDSLGIYGATLLAAAFVHPIPLIPFAVPMFLIFASLYTNEQARAGMVPAPAMRLADRGRWPPRPSFS